ncbi:hypothetical protein M011DRAFT_198531 [Sporormia fimetaria CBS 119925]|uniref:Uncharacterized protein n=1 Tax=Sporormia fimetaria CBS 119925 TaxID=1340428 RepID=A0A6A6V3J6_9PLEO|nr:hypothetical protein M011DRAFT_198531 [Sporormia fimetaria CBS 119925]
MYAARRRTSGPFIHIMDKYPPYLIDRIVGFWHTTKLDITSPKTLTWAIVPPSPVSLADVTATMPEVYIYHNIFIMARGLCDSLLMQAALQGLRKHWCSSGEEGVKWNITRYLAITRPALESAPSFGDELYTLYNFYKTVFLDQVEGFVFDDGDPRTRLLRETMRRDPDVGLDVIRALVSRVEGERKRAGEREG